MDGGLEVEGGSFVAIFGDGSKTLLLMGKDTFLFELKKKRHNKEIEAWSLNQDRF